ncbi:hypothetical protein B0T26DRAFT_738706 [Lasiosphaeria miniovina]|uniref:TauD/TfdA-like domain-containing protein n=1 Tax=Lasiosphaeria miniovina TaxID=1954250 RepID=A0AA40E609_9PEZI|nr:uncharacterized protein B0T26DRAFT_738706 [Lasiosphaeria miniovina]KAK0728330.1 hypothetical protein B0T26DRAFT_738706 [Lasiosphaeria miniovina]
MCSSYIPSKLDTELFWDRERTRERSISEVPPGFPDIIQSPLVWKGSDIHPKVREWKVDLCGDEITAIDAAVFAFEKKYGENLAELTSSTFELPTEFSQRLRKLSDQLYRGVGFQIIHGLDPTKYTPRQKMIMYVGVTAHVCPQRGSVDVAGKGVVGKLTGCLPRRLRAKPPPSFSNSFHTDNCAIMAFYYLDVAPLSGWTLLSSIWQTYNELAASKLEVLHTLAEPWVLDTFKPLSIQPPRHVRPLQRVVGSDKIPVLFRFSRYPVTGFQRERSADRDAADAVQFIAARNAITLPVIAGDVLLVNDMALFHAREGFHDGGVPLKRHLVKMYFRDPEQGWAIPPSMEREWKTAYLSGSDDGRVKKEEIWECTYWPGLEELSMLNG